MSVTNNDILRSVSYSTTDTAGGLYLLATVIYRDGIFDGSTCILSQYSFLRRYLVLCIASRCLRRKYYIFCTGSVSDFMSRKLRLSPLAGSRKARDSSVRVPFLDSKILIANLAVQGLRCNVRKPYLSNRFEYPKCGTTPGGTICRGWPQGSHPHGPHTSSYTGSCQANGVISIVYYKLQDNLYMQLITL